MTVILRIAAVLLALAGFLQISQATLGVGMIAAACLLAILSRLAQAEAHHREVMRELQRQGPPN